MIVDVVFGGAFRGDGNRGGLSRPTARLLTGPTCRGYTDKLGLQGQFCGKLTVRFLSRSLFEYCILAAAHINLTVTVCVD